VKRKLGVAATAGAFAVALVLTLTACGGESGDSNGVASLTSTSGQSTTEDGQSSDDAPRAASRDEQEQAGLDYARCMREHGVDFPDPVNGRFQLRVRPGGQQKLQEAEEACRGILQKVAPKLSEEEEAEVREAALAFARCMREHGVDMPDPEFRPGGGVLQKADKGMVRDPDFEEAQKACEPILENARPGERTPEDEAS
jgi:hypothetical protein